MKLNLLLANLPAPTQTNPVLQYLNIQYIQYSFKNTVCDIT